MIDWSRVDELRDEIGKEDFDEVVEIFMDEVEETIAVIAGDVPDDQLEGHLHFLKGSALNLGFRDFSSLCQAGETAAAQGQFDLIDLPKVIDSYERSKVEFLDALTERHAA
ncbi:MAG: Hpt domain-containing protein [Roseovarius sp.]